MRGCWIQILVLHSGNGHMEKSISCSYGLAHEGEKKLARSWWWRCYRQVCL